MLWALRVGWLALPLTVGTSIAHALDGTSTPVTVVAALLAWLAWGAVLVAVLVPRTVSLTALRIGAPAAVAAAGWCAARNGFEPVDVVAIVWSAALAALVLFVPAITDAFVDGSSYGPERRMALRVPGTLLLGPVEFAWAVVVAGVVAGPLLLAAKIWLLGIVVLAVGVTGAWFAAMAIHRLSRRWIVFTPAGVVLHDQLIAGDVILFTTKMVRSLGPAPAGTDATDVTGRALGLVLELHLTERSKVRAADTDRLLISPVRPGALIQEARARGIATPPPSTSSPS